MIPLAWALAFVAIFGFVGWLSWWMIESAYRGELERSAALKQDKADLRKRVAAQDEEIADLKRTVGLSLLNTSGSAS